MGLVRRLLSIVSGSTAARRRPVRRGPVGRRPVRRGSTAGGIMGAVRGFLRGRGRTRI